MQTAPSVTCLLSRLNGGPISTAGPVPGRGQFCSQHYGGHNHRAPAIIGSALKEPSLNSPVLSGVMKDPSHRPTALTRPECPELAAACAAPAQRADGSRFHHWDGWGKEQ